MATLEDVISTAVDTNTKASQKKGQLGDIDEARKSQKTAQLENVEKLSMGHISRLNRDQEIDSLLGDIQQKVSSGELKTDSDITKFLSDITKAKLSGDASAIQNPKTAKELSDAIKANPTLAKEYYRMRAAAALLKEDSISANSAAGKTAFLSFLENKSNFQVSGSNGIQTQTFIGNLDIQLARYPDQAAKDEFIKELKAAAGNLTDMNAVLGVISQWSQEFTNGDQSNKNKLAHYLSDEMSVEGGNILSAAKAQGNSSGTPSGAAVNNELVAKLEALRTSISTEIENNRNLIQGNLAKLKESIDVLPEEAPSAEGGEGSSPAASGGGQPQTSQDLVALTRLTILKKLGLENAGDIELISLFATHGHSYSETYGTSEKKNDFQDPQRLKSILGWFGPTGTITLKYKDKDGAVQEKHWYWEGDEKTGKMVLDEPAKKEDAETTTGGSSTSAMLYGPPTPQNLLNPQNPTSNIFPPQNNFFDILNGMKKSS